MPNYRVNRSAGWPVMIDNSQAKYALDAIVTDHDPAHAGELADAVAKGHLLPIYLHKLDGNRAICGADGDFVGDGAEDTDCQRCLAIMTEPAAALVSHEELAHEHE